MLIDYQLWRLHQTMNEANAIIDDVNRFLIAQHRRRRFWEDDSVSKPSITLKPHSDHDVVPVPDEKDSGMLSKEEAKAKLPKLGYLHKRDDGQPGAQWFIDEERKKNADPSFNAEKAGIRALLVKAYKDEASIQRDGIRFPPGVIVNKINHRVFNYDKIQDMITSMVQNGELDCCDAVDIRIALKDKVYKMGQQVIDMLSFPLKMPGGVLVDKDDVVDTHNRFYRRDIGELRADRVAPGCGTCGGARSSARWTGGGGGGGKTGGGKPGGGKKFGGGGGGKRFGGGGGKWRR